MKKRILIIGGDSLIGKHLSLSFKQRKIDFVKTTRKKNSKNSIYLNLKEINKSYKKLLNSFDIIIFCISMTDINTCEIRPYDSYFLNVKQTLLLFSYIKKKTKVYYMSSASVFDGHRKRCNENDSHLPLNQYGIHKAIVEKNIMWKKNFIIIRISKIISRDMDILRDWKKRISNNIKIKAYNDRFISPISIKYFIKVLTYIIFNEDKKIIHISSNNVISRYEFAKFWFEKNNIDKYYLQKSTAQNSFKQANLIKKSNLNFCFLNNIKDSL